MSEVVTRNGQLTLERKADLIFNHKYLGFGNCDSECKVEIWINVPSSNGDICIVLFTDLGKGTSVTNFSEGLVTQIYEKHLKHGYKKEQCVFAETYDRIQIDIVLPNWEGDKCNGVNWKHLGMIIK